MGGGFLRAFPNLYSACCILTIRFSSRPLRRRWGGGTLQLGRGDAPLGLRLGETELCWDVFGVGLRVVNCLLERRDLVLGKKELELVGILIVPGWHNTCRGWGPGEGKGVSRKGSWAAPGLEKAGASGRCTRYS